MCQQKKELKNPRPVRMGIEGPAFFFFFCPEHRQERGAEQSVPVPVQGQHLRASGQLPEPTRPGHIARSSTVCSGASDLHPLLKDPFPQYLVKETVLF